MAEPQELDDWLPTLRSKLQTIEGLAQVHDHTDSPAVLLAFPTLIIRVLEGDEDWRAGGPNIGHYRLRLTLYAAAQVLPAAQAVAVPFIARVRNKLAANMQLDGLVSHVLPAPGALFFEGPGAIDYGYTAAGAPAQHLGINFNVEVKTKHQPYTVQP
jgi:hypothetical protein